MDVDLGEMVTDSRLIGMQISARGSRALSREGLTAIQARVLLYILVRSKHGTSLTEIHRETGYSMAATSGLIKRLREKDYVRVEACKLDERRKLLFPTEKGERVRESINTAMSNMPKVLYNGFTDDELVMLNQLQKKILKNLSANSSWIMEG